MSNLTTNLTAIDPIDSAIGFTYTYIIPVICFCGVAANIINVLVFSSRELSDITFKYLRFNAFCNIVYLFICFFLFFGRCGNWCSFETSYFGVFYLQYFYNYGKGMSSFRINRWSVISVQNFKVKYFKKLKR